MDINQQANSKWSKNWGFFSITGPISKGYDIFKASSDSMRIDVIVSFNFIYFSANSIKDIFKDEYANPVWNEHENLLNRIK